MSVKPVQAQLRQRASRVVDQGQGDTRGVQARPWLNAGRQVESVDRLARRGAVQCRLLASQLPTGLVAIAEQSQRT
jgi:hypothetical protein